MSGENMGLHPEWDKSFVESAERLGSSLNALEQVLGGDSPAVVSGREALANVYAEYAAKVEPLRAQRDDGVVKIAELTSKLDAANARIVELEASVAEPAPSPTPTPTPEPAPAPVPTPSPSLEPQSTSKVPSRPSLFSGDRPGAPNLEKLPSALQKQFDTLEAFHSNPKRSPNLENLKLKTHPEVFLDDGKKTPRPIFGLMGMARGSQKGIHDLMIENRVFRNDYAVHQIAKWALLICSSTIDRTLKNPETGQYAGTYGGFLKKAQARYPKMTEAQVDMVGVKRFPYLNGLADFDWHDGHALDFGLAFGTFVEVTRFLKDNVSMGGDVERAYRAMEDLVFNHILPRMTFIAKVNYGEKARPYMWCQNLRHAYLSVSSGWERVWELTGQASLSAEVEQLWTWWREHWRTVPLPDGRTGIGGTHGVAGPAKAKGHDFYGGWHNTIYTEETMYRLAVDAVVFGGAGPTVLDVEQGTNLLYHTLPRYGWTHGSKIAGDTGGGGKLAALEQRKIAMFTDGSSVPAHAYVGHDFESQKPAIPDYDWSGAFRRGGTLVGAPWTDIPDFEQRLKDVHQLSVNEAKDGDKYMGCLILPIALFEAKRAGMLPTTA